MQKRLAGDHNHPPLRLIRRRSLHPFQHNLAVLHRGFDHCLIARVVAGAACHHARVVHPEHINAFSVHPHAPLAVDLIHRVGPCVNHALALLNAGPGHAVRKELVCRHNRHLKVPFAHQLPVNLADHPARVPVPHSLEEYRAADLAPYLAFANNMIEIQLRRVALEDLAAQKRRRLIVVVARCRPHAQSRLHASQLGQSGCDDRRNVVVGLRAHPVVHRRHILDIAQHAVDVAVLVAGQEILIQPPLQLQRSPLLLAPFVLVQHKPHQLALLGRLIRRHLDLVFVRHFQQPVSQALQPRLHIKAHIHFSLPAPPCAAVRSAPSEPRNDPHAPAVFSHRREVGL